MDKNYEDIKLYLFKNVMKEDLETVIKGIQEALKLNLKEINKVLNVMHEDREILMLGDDIYVIDDIHYKVGVLRVIRGQFAFIGIGEESVYIHSSDFNDAIDGDEVLIQIIHKEKVSGKVLSVLNRSKEYILGTINDRGYFIPYDRKFNQRAILKTNGVEVHENQRVIAKIDKVEKNVLYLTLHSVLGMADEPGIDILSVLFEHDLQTEFEEDVLEEAKALPDKVLEKDLENRMDHRDQMAITIDGEDAKDLDDAVYLEPLHEGYRLYVHIADVSYYVRKSSAIDKTAYVRTSSIYMVDRVIPMLPKEISNGICSLYPNVERLTLTCKMDIDLEGNIYNYEVYPSVIESKKRMSYREINDGDDFGEYTEMIQMMLELSAILEKKRRQEGSIDFDSSETEFLVDHEGKVLDVFSRTQGKSEKMIEQFMVSANESVAKYCKHMELPILYRVHEKPDKDKMQDFSHMLRILGYRLRGKLDDVHPHTMQKVLKHFEGKDELPVVSRLMLRSMKKARYTHTPLGHFGLALDDYAHFTAPIRRYSDLLLHRSLHDYVFNGDFSNYDEDFAFVQEAGEHISTKERDILDAEREVEKMKKAEFMEDKVGMRYDGIISGVSNFGLFVELENTVEGVVPLKDMKDDFYTVDAVTQKLVGERTGNIYSIGQKIKVEVVGINPLEHDVLMKIRRNRGMRRGKKHRKNQKSFS